MKNLRHVEFAVALDRHRNFARAAESMRVTQPTFSRGIAALEADLGVRLFDRSTRQVQPTPAGAVFLERATALLADASWVRDGLDDYSHLRSGVLTIGAGPYPLEVSVIPAVARLAASHPQLQIRLVEAHWREFVQKILSGAVEVVVMEASILVPDPRFQVEPLPRHQGCFFCRSGHALAGRTPRSVEELNEYPFVGVPMLRQVGPRLGGVLSHLTVDQLTGDMIPQIAITSIAAMREIVKRTDGIGLCVPNQIDDDVRAGRVTILRTLFEPPSTAYGVAWLRGKTLSPAAQTFVEILRTVERELNTARPGRVTRKPKARARRFRSLPGSAVSGPP
jgi:DNA-binding transcriptional LysR family regulator